MSASERISPGTVYLLGAGPGNPGLITLRAVECLQQADLVLYDYLANPAALEHAAATAELVCLGHHSAGRFLSPEEIVTRMVEEALCGKTVVRLKGGDPSVFGRGVDEIKPLRDAGIPFEIVPGITAGLAVGAFCEIPVTHHELASAVALITGRERRGKAESGLDYHALASFPGTLIFYMGVTRAGQWSQALIENGKPANTPVAIVRWCTWSNQQTMRCTLETVADFVKEQELRPPALFVVGEVVDQAPLVSWFANRPLSHTRVLVPGSPATSDKLRRRLTSLGADVLVEPVVRITDPPDWRPVDNALARLEDYDWLVFSSGNGVEYFLRRLFQQGGDTRRLGHIQMAAVGSATADRLSRYHLQADVVPDQFCAESLAQTLVSKAQGQRFLLAGTTRGPQILADAVQAAGGQVQKLTVYGSVDVESPNPSVSMALDANEINWIPITSSATARSLVRLYGDALRSARLASISPLTSAALRELGYPPAAEASPHTMDALVDAILQVAGQGRDESVPNASPTQ